MNKIYEVFNKYNTLLINVKKLLSLCDNKIILTNDNIILYKELEELLNSNNIQETIMNEYKQITTLFDDVKDNLLIKLLFDEINTNICDIFIERNINKLKINDIKKNNNLSNFIRNYKYSIIDQNIKIQTFTNLLNEFLNLINSIRTNKDEKTMELYLNLRNLRPDIYAHSNKLLKIFKRFQEINNNLSIHNVYVNNKMNELNNLLKTNDNLIHYLDYVSHTINNFGGAHLKKLYEFNYNNECIGLINYFKLCVIQNN